MDRISPIAPRSRSEPPLAPISRESVQSRRRDREAEDAERKRRREAELIAEGGLPPADRGPGEDGGAHIDIRV